MKKLFLLTFLFFSSTLWSSDTYKEVDHMLCKANGEYSNDMLVSVYLGADIEINEEEAPEGESLLKRVSRVVITIMLILMMLSFVIPYGVLFSLIESNKIENYKIEAGEKTIIFYPDVYERIKTYYLQNQLH